MDRAVIIRMRRRAPGEQVDPYRIRRDRPRLEAIRRDLGNGRHTPQAARPAAPDLPVEDRPADNWEPLVAVADPAGGDWPARARKAAMQLCAEDEQADIPSPGLRLLADIRDIFEDMTVSFLASAVLTDQLRKLPSPRGGHTS